MTSETQRAKAKRFLTSAGVALSLGYPDGERVSRSEMLEAVRRIVTAVAIPVTADLEAGYGPTVNDAAETARAAIAAGAVGMNFEDSTSDDRLVDVASQVERIRAIKKVASARSTVPSTCSRFGEPRRPLSSSSSAWHG